MAFTGPIEDRAAIRDLYGLYADAASHNDRAGWLACWSENGRWTSHIFDCTGKAELVDQWDAILAGFTDLIFMSEICAIEVAGDHGTGRSVAREIGRLVSGGIYKLVGRYKDAFVRENGQWRFARRDYAPVVEELPL